MASYRQIEDLPVWQAAIDLAATVFDLTSHPAFKFRGDLVNQIRRAALSVSNNIAEGFERGTTADLINFLYISRGSCGETRSMLRFAPKLGGMEDELGGIEAAARQCESVSRQLYGWIDALKNSSIDGQKKLTDESRQDYQLESLKDDFRKRFNPQAEEQARKDGRHIEYLRAKVEAIGDLNEAKHKAQADAPKCPACGAGMVKRHDRHGRTFWGCSQYPRCQGSRPYSKN